jgi:hypothetical protein
MFLDDPEVVAVALRIFYVVYRSILHRHPKSAS